MDLHDVDLNLLKVFEALFIDENVSKAAKRLGVAQSSLSSSLKRLRTLFQDELFLRSPKGMLPTNRALAIEPSVTDCLRAARLAIKSPGEFDPAASKRTFVIGGSDFSAFTLLPSLIRFLKENSPCVRLVMKPLPLRELPHHLESGTVDFAITSWKNYPKRLSSRALFDEDMVIIARKGHPDLNHKESLSLEDYAKLQHIYISSKGEGEKIIDKRLSESDLQRDIYLKVQNFLVVPYIVEESDLIATVSERVAYQCSQSARLDVFPFPVKVEKNNFHLLWSKGVESDQECLWLIDSISKLFADIVKPHA